MNHVREMFCTTINDEVKACGFHHNRNIYYKAVDGALLGFGIDTKLTHYSVLFGCYPLCGAIPPRHAESFACYDIACILPQYRNTPLYVIPCGADVTEKEQAEAWENRGKIYEDIAYQLADETRTVLLPKLLKIDSIKAAFDFETECRLAAARYRDQKLAHLGIDKAQAPPGSAPFPFTDCFWYLRLHEYSKAKTYLENDLAPIRRALEQDPTYRTIYETQGFAEYENLCDMLSDGDTDGIEKYIISRETQTLKNFGPKKQKPTVDKE